MKYCPSCKEAVLIEGPNYIVCQHCGWEVRVDPRAARTSGFNDLMRCIYGARAWGRLSKIWHRRTIKKGEKLNGRSEKIVEEARAEESVPAISLAAFL